MYVQVTWSLAGNIVAVGGLLRSYISVSDMFDVETQQSKHENDGYWTYCKRA